MKDIKQYFFIIISLISLGLMSCSQEPIFSAIEQEIKLKDPNVRGIVTSLVTVKNGASYDLYTTDGTIYKKTGGTTGDWKTISNPSSVHRCAMLASDNDYLYGLFQDSDFKPLKIYRRENSTWVPVTDISKPTFLAGQGTVFAFTGSENSYTAYVITDSSATAITGATGLATPVGASGTYFATTDGVYDIKGTIVGGTNAPSSGIKGFTTDKTGTHLYAIDSGYLYHHNPGDSSWNKVAHSKTSPSSLNYYTHGSTTILLFGSSKGYGEIVLNLDGKPEKYQSPGSSAPSSISTSAETQYKNSIGLWNVHSIFTDGTTIYASVNEASNRNNGLWGYYKSKNEWNRE